MKTLTFTLAMALLVFCRQLMGVEATQVLNESGDPSLQQALEALVLEQKLTDAVNQQELALALVIFTDHDKPC